jgi:Cu/Ag efflux pump CusA
MKRSLKWALVVLVPVLLVAAVLRVLSARQAVIGGVITSSLLTLVVVPVVYCYMDDLSQWMRRRFGPQGPRGRVKFQRIG